MRIIKNSLLFLSLLALAQRVAAQAPSISYSNANHILIPGTPVSFSPVNTGGAVPAGTYSSVTTVAGSPSETAGYVNASDTSALFNFPQHMVKDASGNLYVADAINNAIRKITPAGVVSTFAGSTTGLSGLTDATGTAALFSYPDGITIDGSGNLFVSDYINEAIRKITPAGVVSTFYVSSGTFGPGGLCFDNSGNLIVTAQDASQVLSINTSAVATVIAGSTPGYVNATGTAAQFNTPTDVKVDASGNIYVADFENNAIRKITSAGVVTTFAGSDVNGNTPGFANGKGTAAIFNNPPGLSIGPGGVIYVADMYNNDIRRILPDGTVTLLAGSAAQSSGDTNGTGTAAGFDQPDYIYTDNTGTAYVAELGGNRIRKIQLTGYTLKGTLPSGLSFNSTTGIISGTPSGSIGLVTDTVTSWNASGYSTAVIKFIGTAPVIAYDMTEDTIASGVPYTLNVSNTGGDVPATTYAQASTVAGSTSGTSGYTNGSGTSARFSNPSASASDGQGNIYIADAGNNAIRRIDASGAVTTFAGSTGGSSGFTDANGTSALFSAPDGLVFDGLGNLFVSDYANNAIRKIDASGNVTTFYHSTGTFGPGGLTIDASGNLIVAARDLHQIIQITPSAAASAIAGSTSGYTNATGTSAQFNTPTDVKMDASGNLFVADYANNAIRQIDPTGAVTTFAGSTVSGNTGSYLDSVGTAARFNGPRSLAIAPGGVLYVADLGNNGIRRILPDGTVNLIAGSSSQTSGNSDGTGLAASFNQPNSIALDAAVNAYVTESSGNRVRTMPLTGYSLASVIPAGLSLNASTGEISGTISGTVPRTPFTIAAFNAAGFSLFIPLLVTTNDWKGGGLPNPADWGQTNNWSANHVPTTTETARIGTNLSYTVQPVISVNETTNVLAFGNAFAPAGGPVLTIINSTATLTLKANITMVSTSATTATINGPGGIVLTANTQIPANGTLTAAGNLVITFNTNSFITNTSGGSFTLGSDANGASSIAALPVNASGVALSGVTGPVTVQRFITGGSGYRGYRLLTSPVYVANVTIGSNTTTTNVLGLNYLQANTYLTGSGSTGGGFDQFGNPTLYIYREDLPILNATFIDGPNQGVANINQAPLYNYLLDPWGGLATPYTTFFNLPVGTGYLFFFRGEKTATAAGGSPYSSGTTPVQAVLAATGLLNQGTIAVQYWFNGSTTFSYTPSGANGFHLVGNPYPSSIDWNKFSATVTTNAIYGPNFSTSYSALINASGTYGTYDAASGLSTPASTLTNIIPSGAGFFVQATSGGPASLTFTEAAKVPAQLPSGTGSLFLSANIVNKPNRQYLRLELNADTVHREDVVIWFNNDNKIAYEPGTDAMYLQGYDKVSLSSLSSDQVQLAINKQPLPGKERRVIGLHATTTANGTYHFNLREVVGLPRLYDVMLVDALTKDSVDLRSKTSYEAKFDTLDNKAMGNKRFSLVIKQNPAYAYRLLNFTANKVAAVRQVEVAWKTQNEDNYTNFTVERSTDGGQTFEALGNLRSTGAVQYSLLDKNPVVGQNIYRLKQTDVNDAVSYSKNIGILYTDLNDALTGNKLNIYPNPASSTISLAIATDATSPATYKISFTNSMGTVVKTFTSSQASWQGNISSLLPGSYLVRVTDDKTQSFVAESKFVKL
jgi:sugar lactone lactonase YvrE